MMTQPGLRLHYAPDNASLCVRLALEELGLDYETTLLDRRQKAQKQPAYLALNPNGLIPVLETPDGALYETGAILLWLADRYGGGLMPDVQDNGRGAALKWLFWLSNTLHAQMRMLFYPEQYIDGDEQGDALRSHTRTRLRVQLDLLATATDARWLDSTQPSAQGCYLAALLRWPSLYGGPSDWYQLQDWPRLLAFAQRTEARPASLRSAIAEELGATPFSAPQPANPANGSAI